MKEEKTKKRRFLYYLVLAICVCLLTAATVLTVYFVTDDNANSLETEPPVTDILPPTGDDDKKPDNKPAGGEAESFCDPVVYNEASVYNVIYASRTTGFIYRHKGVDFAAEEGANVAAIADGTVLSISLNEKTGNVITVDHGKGLIGYYRFVEPASTLRKGAKITKGQNFATVAAAYGCERMDGTHLHLELELKGKQVDPASYLNIQYAEK
ncbi:MAG: M23 family metallopeptidase [Clostridia bacterium]|nr:M23 family metallopeptidase [Clostridia bacterium]